MGKLVINTIAFLLVMFFTWDFFKEFIPVFFK